MKTEEINIAEILKDCPVGMELYSPCLGKVLFEEVNNGVINVTDNDNLTKLFFANGKMNSEGECMLFPSSDQRDWSKFKKPVHPPFEVKKDDDKPYYFFKSDGKVYPNVECGDGIFCGLLEYGNYFNTSEQAEYAAKKVRELLFSLRKEAANE